MRPPPPCTTPGRDAAWSSRCRTRSHRAPNRKARRCSTRCGGAAARRAPGGFKIGATAKRMQEYLGLSGPAAGFMATGGLHRSGASLRFADFQRPGVECELAVRLGHDLPPGPCTRAQAAEAVGELMAGIELVENRYTDLGLVGTPTMIADQVYHAAAIVGEPSIGDWRDLDVATLRGRLIVDGQQRDEGVGADLMGHPLNCLAWLAGCGSPRRSAG